MDTGWTGRWEEEWVRDESEKSFPQHPSHSLTRARRCPSVKGHCPSQGVLLFVHQSSGNFSHPSPFPGSWQITKPLFLAPDSLAISQGSSSPFAYKPLSFPELTLRTLASWPLNTARWLFYPWRRGYIELTVMKSSNMPDWQERTAKHSSVCFPPPSLTKFLHMEDGFLIPLKPKALRASHLFQTRHRPQALYRRAEHHTHGLSLLSPRKQERARSCRSLGRERQGHWAGLFATTCGGPPIVRSRSASSWWFSV